jgi:hypothetical protein
MTGQLSRSIVLEMSRRLMSRLRAGQDVRYSKVRGIRRRIRAGTYLDSFKLSIAIDRLLEGCFE